MTVDVKYEISTEGSVRVSREVILDAYARGGVTAIRDLLQEEIDDDVTRNVAVVLEDKGLNRVLSAVGLIP